MKISNISLFNFLPKSYKVDNFSTDEDDIYTLAHDIVIGATQYASNITEIPFEDFDDEREEAIEYVIERIVEENEVI